ncbi:MAG: CPBP family intramembrane metalloprotease [Prolixibacteraceae bacterium]|nr:CPBP family intramembrane metalloprotease [Prolixibacteraceae bacterium]
MAKQSLFRSAWFWSALVILAIISTVFLYFNFEKANPLVNISVEMDREEALGVSSERAQKYGLGSEKYRQAAGFINDTKFQNYTELEGGGLDTFNDVVSKGIYHSYQWHIRHFKENEINEVTFFFTPDGAPYGFSETISEDLLLPSVSADSARAMAKQAASEWGVDMSAYELVEKSTNETPAGRTDHTFTFEREDNPVGESRFRVTFEISGNKLTRVAHHVKIPEDFERRYSEMRSQNSLVSSIGQVFLFVVYGLVGIGLFLFFLTKKRFLLWRKALWWAVAIGLATGVFYVLNSLPLLWLDYDTTTSAANFVTRQLFNGLLNTMLMGSIIFLSAMAAEGMGRYLFGNHVQFWKVWGKEAGASKQVLAQTVGAYLFVPAFLALDVLYYLLTTKYLGWWNPAGTLSDPNVLAENMPWYTSIAISLQAGFWEEIMCRAIPLAGVYFLVRKRKSKNFWMLLTLLAQAIIFGMLHANYPQSPSYARVFEMVIPFTIFGLIYLRFGLLPVIITHYAVDVFWISLPIFVAKGSGIWFNQLIIILLLFVPVWIILYWRFKNRKWSEAPDSVLNKSFKPKPLPPKTENNNVEEAPENQPVRNSVLKLKWLVPAAVLGLLAWLFLSFPNKVDAPKVEITKQEAQQKAEQVLAEKFGFNPEGWETLIDIRSTPSKQHKYVWLTAPDDYSRLQSGFLNPPYWIVRYVQTTAGPEERIEEYTVKIGVDGRLLSYKHVWPEKREGASLSEDEAAELAIEALQNFTSPGAEGLDTVKVTPSKLTARTDWEFEFSDTINYKLEKGQGRYRVSIAGDEVNGISRFVFIPEAWERDYDKSQSQLGIFKLISNLAFYLILILGIVLGFVNWSKNRFSSKLFFFFAFGYFIISALGILNSWDSLLAGYVTVLPFKNFLIMALIGAFVGLLFLGMGAGVIGGYSCQLAAFDQRETRPVLKAFLGGVVLTGLLAVIEKISPKTAPNWVGLDSLNAWLPFFNPMANNFVALIYMPAFAMIIFFLANQLSKHFAKRKALALLFVFVLGFLAFGRHAVSVNEWLLSGAVYAVIITLYYLLFRGSIRLLPVVFIVPFLFYNLKVSLTGIYPNVFINLLPLLIFGCIIAFFWYRGITKCAMRSRVSS